MSFTDIVISRNEGTGSFCSTKLTSLIPALLVASMSVLPPLSDRTDREYEIIQTSDTFSQTVEITRMRVKTSRAKLVKRLIDLREEAVAKGMTLMTEENILAEINSRRGEET
jgi:hypothetical protein